MSSILESLRMTRLKYRIKNWRKIDPRIAEFFEWALEHPKEFAKICRQISQVGYTTKQAEKALTNFAKAVRKMEATK